MDRFRVAAVNAKSRRKARKTLAVTVFETEYRESREATVNNKTKESSKKKKKKDSEKDFAMSKI